MDMSSPRTRNLAIVIGLAVAISTRGAEEAGDSAIAVFDEGEFLLCWAAQTQAVERTLLVALQRAEGARLKPWWLPPLDEFSPDAKTEQARREVVEQVLNEAVPRYVFARYPARLGRYDHDRGASRSACESVRRTGGRDPRWIRRTGGEPTSSPC